MTALMTSSSHVRIAPADRRTLLAALAFVCCTFAWSVSAAAAPEVAVGLEMEAKDFNHSDSYELSANPVLTLEWPAYEYNIEAKRTYPYYPEDAEAGEFELSQEYLLHLPVWWLDLGFEATNTWIYEDEEHEGTIAAGPVVFFLETEFKLLFENQYSPESGHHLIPSALYEFELLRGTAGIEFTHTMDMDNAYEAVETELAVTYEIDVFEEMAIGFEFDDTYVQEDEDFFYTFIITVEWSP